MDSQRLVVGLDLDGTLVSCKEKQVYALQKALQSFDVEYWSFDAFWELKRDGSTTIDALCRTGIGRAMAEKLAKQWIENVETWECLQRDRIFPGAMEVLGALLERADLFLLSARRNAQMLERQVEELGLNAYLAHREVVLANGNVSNAKAACLVKYGARCYIGDTESDMTASRKANIPVYLVTTGQRSAEFLRRHAECNRESKLFSRLELAVEEAARDLNIPIEPLCP